MYVIRHEYVMCPPEMTDYAWAVPRWVVDCNYIDDENREVVERFCKTSYDSTDIWSAWEIAQIPVKPREER